MMNFQSSLLMNLLRKSRFLFILECLMVPCSFFFIINLEKILEVLFYST